jgi:hypothetical protein
MNKLKARYEKGEINDKEATFLRYMSFLPYSGVPFSNFSNWADTINSLGEKGYIKQKDNNGEIFIYMEPEISVEVFDETGANSENCKEMLEGICEMESDHDNIRANPYLRSVAEFVLERLGDEKSEMAIRYNKFAMETCFALGDIEKASYYSHREIDMYRAIFGDEAIDEVFREVLGGMKKDEE